MSSFKVKLWPTYASGKPLGRRGAGRQEQAHGDHIDHELHDDVAIRLSGCGRGARDRGPAHIARLAFVVAPHAMHHLAVVPHDQIAHAPLVDVDELRLRGVLVQVSQQDARLRHRHAEDGAGVRREIERLAAAHGMRAHEPLADRPEHRPLLQVEHAQRSARVHERVLADEVLDLRLDGRVERVVGRAHVGELGVAADRIHDAGRQERVLRRDRPERAVGVPEHVAEIEQAHARVARQRLAVAAEIRHVVPPGLQALVLGLGDVAAAGVFERAEVAAERHLLLVGDLLVVEHEHRVAIHPRLDPRHLVGGERPADVDAGHFAHEHGMDLADGQTHGLSLP